MRNIVKQNKQFLLAFFGVLLIILSCSIFISNSDMLTKEVAIKSITPIYDEEGTYSVGNTGVIFNDKEQVVKYNIVIENRKNYDVKVSDLQLSTPTEDFLNYTVENINVDDVIKAGESKELIVSFETVKMDGWGRNFNDELVTTLVFYEVKKQEEVVVPPVVDTKPNTNEPTNKVENNTSNNVQPEVNEPVVNEPVIEQPKEEIKDEVVTIPEDDVNHELGMNQEIIVKDAHPEDVVVIFCFGIATGVLGIGLVMVNKNKFTKYIVLFVIVGSSVKLAQADEIMSLEIPINVSYESQNVMMAVVDEEGNLFEDTSMLYSYITNVYIENEIREISNYLGKIDVSYEQNERVIAYIVENTDDGIACQSTGLCWDLYIQADGIIYPNENMSYYFAMENLNMISNLEGFDTSNVTNMKGTFARAGYNSQEFTLDLSNFDTSNVTDMSNMFAYAGYNSTIFELDISGFDTSKVTNMNNMFREIGKSSESFTLDVSGFNTSKVTNMGHMFAGAGYSNPNFTLDVSNFDTSNVTDMSYMFSQTGYNSENLTLDVSNFDTSNVTNMSWMFAITGYSSTNFTLDLSNFDTSNVTNMSGMFGYTGYNNPNFTLDISNFDTSNVTNMSDMFYSTGYNSTTFTPDVSNFDTSNVTNMSKMFSFAGYNNPNYTLDLYNFNTSKVTNMSRMFEFVGHNAQNLTIDVSNFDTSNVTNMEYMFYWAGAVTTDFILDLGAFDTSKVTNMYNMFSYTGFKSLNFNTTITIRNPNITSYSMMFSRAATQPGSQITVNYTNETSDLVDKMIATKSSDSNVVKGENIEIGYLKLFPLNNNGDSEIFNFINGMTWSEWINSEYNTKGLTISGNKILYQGKYTVTQETESGSKRVVSPNDLITSGYPCYYEQASLA